MKPYIILLGLLLIASFVIAITDNSVEDELIFNTSITNTLTNNSIEDTLIFGAVNGTAPVTDSCTYSGSGNWNVNCSQACTITNNYNLSGQIMNLTGTGIIYLNSTITVPTNSIVYVNTGCTVNINTAGKFT